MRGKPKILCKDHWTMVPCDISIHFEQSIRWYAVEKFWAELSDQVGCLSNFHCPNIFKHLPPIAAHNLCLSCCWLHPYKICIAVVCPRSNYCTNGKYPGCYPCKMMQICNVDIYIDVDMAPLTKKQPPFRFDFWFWILTWLLGTRWGFVSSQHVCIGNEQWHNTLAHRLASSGFSGMPSRLVLLVLRRKERKRACCRPGSREKVEPMGFSELCRHAKRQQTPHHEKGNSRLETISWQLLSPPIPAMIS